METYDLTEAAERIGVMPGRLAELVDHGGPGQVIVSQAVVDAADGAAVAFRDVGLVELKGLVGAMRLYAAHRPD